MTLSLGELLSFAGIFLGLLASLVKLLLWQFEKRLAERFNIQTEAIRGILDRQDRDADALRELETSFLRFQADLPLHYVRREDWVRNQAVIESKLDGLALRIENLQLKGAHHD
ncbi:hypothetical protein D3C84_266670 [compost metagenome]